MYTIIQSHHSADRRALIKLLGDARVAPSGNVVGPYRVVFPTLKRDAALRVLTRLFQTNKPVSLWWNGAAADISARLEQQT